ncbi:hypothetical protein RQP46_002498 [Phenoliferia psychrophenolica]
MRGVASASAPSRPPRRPKHYLGDLPGTLLLALLSSTVLPQAVHAFSASFVSPLHLSAARRAVLSERSTSTAPVYSNSSQAIPTISNSTTANEGRYGHSAVYLAASNSVLFIGGQVGDNGTVVTADVLQFELESAFLWGKRPLSAIPDNPRASPLLEAGLPPHAWAAAALDAANRTWLIGGVTQNCETDGIAYTLTVATEGAQKGWASERVSPWAPPRRRQAQAVSVLNSTTNGADLYVFGGIAERYTCSEETIGYFGIDRWDTVHGTVETLPWNAPAGWTGAFDPPVSDYTATLLQDKSSIVLVGGQTAAGDLVGMGSVQVFNTGLRSWLSVNTTGSVPDARMGHVAIALPSGAILIHGGVGHDGTPVSSTSILTPPLDLSSSSPWTWSISYLGNYSLAAPARAWHTATLTPTGAIVVAFGIDSIDGSPSADLFSLSLDSKDRATWNNTFVPKVLAIKPVVITAVKAIVNPKAVSAKLSSFSGPGVVSPPKPSPSTPSPSPPPTTYSYTDSSSAHSSSATSSSMAGATLAESVLQAKMAAAAAAKQRSIVGGVGTAVGVAAILLLAALIVRCRSLRNRGGVQLNSPALSYAAPLVSTLLYTRPVVRRRLSLGSTVSEHHPSPSLTPILAPDSPSSSTQTIREVHPSNPNPFADPAVNEHGQLHRAPSMAAQTSIASVFSAPYLHNVYRTQAEARDDDSFTSLPRSLRSIRADRDAQLQAGEEWDLFDDQSMATAPVSRKASKASMFDTPILPYPSFPATGGDEPTPPLPRTRNSLSVRNADPFSSP